MNQEHLPITGLPVGAVSPSVIVCGDPARAERVAARLDGATLLSDKREYRALRGDYGGQPITVCSHGIGAPGAAIAFEELIAAGARRIIRVGTCGGLQPDLAAGDLIVATAAVQNTGYGRETVPDGYPAVADPALTLALVQAVAAARPIVRRGLVLSRDSFYPGVAAPAAPDYRTMSAARVLAVEMECAALFLVGSLRDVATAAVLVVDGNVLAVGEGFDTYQPGQPVVADGVDAAIGCALEALRERGMTGIQDKRRTIRYLLREDEPADAMAAYYALYHPDDKTTLVVPPVAEGQRANGYVALSRTGIDLFRPLVTMRLPIDRDPAAAQGAADLLRLALGSGQPAILSAPVRYLPLLRALFDIQSEEHLRLYALAARDFEPIVNVLVTRGLGPGGLARYTIRSSQSGQEEVVADATLNWQSPRYGEIAVNTRPQHRRQGWGRSVVAALSQHLLDSGRTPLYVVSEENAASIQLAESVGFRDTGAREVFLQAALRDQR